MPKDFKNNPAPRGERRPGKQRVAQGGQAEENGVTNVHESLWVDDARVVFQIEDGNTIQRARRPELA